jgi:hypothetical protein
MFFESGFFWFLMGSLFVLVAAGFKAFADDRGWVMTWWKALLGVIWYGIFSVSFLAWGTLIGENEGGAGFRIFLLGMFISLVLGVGLWRLMQLEPAAEEQLEE